MNPSTLRGLCGAGSDPFWKKYKRNRNLGNNVGPFYHSP